MLGGLIIPTVNRQGSGRFDNGSGYLRSSSNLMDSSSPSMRYFAPPLLPGLGSSRDFESTYFGYNLPSPLHSGLEVSHPGFQRYASADSMSNDVSPHEGVVQPHIFPKVVKTNVVSGNRLPELTSYPEEQLPGMKLGDEGRAKLKSALSDAVRRDPDMKARVESIGKIRLASVQQLVRMAKECNLWEYVEVLALEHEMSKDLRRSS